MEIEEKQAGPLEERNAMYIVYRSNTGFTRQYAQMLGKAENRKVVALEEGGIPEKVDVFYMGPLMAGHISGIDKAVKRYNVKGACGVGMSPPSEKVLSDLARSNYVPDAPIFYLQGGWAPEKVGWMKRRMVNMVTKSMREALERKKKRTDVEQANLDMLLHGGSFVAYENLEPIRKWLGEQG